MKDFDIEAHKRHISTFFENFAISLENRRSDEERLECFDYYLMLEQQRLNRYLNVLTPDLYIDHKLYTDEIKDIILRLTYEKDIFEKTLNDCKVVTYKWELEGEQIKLLFEKLKGNFISTETSFEAFEFLFSGQTLKVTNKKIEWLKYGQNKAPNKKSITDFIDILNSKKIISKPDKMKKIDEVKILNSLFSSQNKSLNFTNSNFVTPRSKSTYNAELERLISSIL